MKHTVEEFNNEGRRIIEATVTLRIEMQRTQTLEPETWGNLFYQLGQTMAFHQAACGDAAIPMAAAGITSTALLCISKQVLTDDAITTCVQAGYDAGRTWLDD